MGALIYKAPELLSLPLAPPASTERFICVMRFLGDMHISQEAHFSCARVDTPSRNAPTPLLDISLRRHFDLYGFWATIIPPS